MNYIKAHEEFLVLKDGRPQITINHEEKINQSIKDVQVEPLGIWLKVKKNGGARDIYVCKKS